jgi:hypothetical protein
MTIFKQQEAWYTTAVCNTPTVTLLPVAAPFPLTLYLLFIWWSDRLCCAVVGRDACLPGRAVLESGANVKFLVLTCAD